VSSLHYHPTWHGDVEHSKSAQRQTSHTSMSQQSSPPVVFDNVTHSPTAAPQEQTGARRGLFARFFPRELKRAFGLIAPTPHLSVLDFVRRRRP
jgi:hypothetical protein